MIKELEALRELASRKSFVFRRRLRFDDVRRCTSGNLSPRELRMRLVSVQRWTERSGRGCVTLAYSTIVCFFSFLSMGIPCTYYVTFQLVCRSFELETCWFNLLFPSFCFLFFFFLWNLYVTSKLERRTRWNI